MRSSSPSRAVSRAAARCAQASTAATSSAPRLVAVLADQPGQLGPPLLHHAEPGRVGLDRRGVGREVGAHVGQQVADLLQPGDQVGQRRVGHAQLLQRGPGGGHQRGRVAALVVGGLRDPEQGVVGQRRRGPQAVGVTQPLLLDQQRGRLPRLRVGRLELAEAEPQQVGLLGPVAGQSGQLSELGADRSLLVVRRPVGARGGRRPPLRRSGRTPRAGGPVAAAATGRSGRAPPRRTRPARPATPAGTPRPPRKARDRPVADTVRATSSTSSSSSAPASVARAATAPSGSTRSRPSTDAVAAPGRTAPGSARPPNSSPRPVTTMVLPAPGLAGHDREARRELEHGVLDHAEAADPHLLEHAGEPTRTVGRNRPARPGRASRAPAGRTSPPAGR